MKVIFLTLFFISFQFCEAQISHGDAADAAAKYWLYRWRFVNDFIKVGEQQGESIPMGERNADGLSENYAKFGDGTQKIGMYLCMLATEFKLLQNNNRFPDLEKTKTELYYALMAFERLDFTAETYYSPPIPAMNNGFFFRDDVPADFLTRPAKPWDPTNSLINKDLFNKEFTKFCYINRPQNMTVDNIANKSLTGGEDYLNGDFVTMIQYDATQMREENINDMSKDQAIAMFMGWGLVVMLVDDNTYDVKLNDGNIISFNFHQKAKEQYDRVLKYIKKQTIFGIPTLSNDWIIHNPFDIPVERGPIAIDFSFPMAQAGNIVLGPNSNLALYSPYLGIPVGYHDLISLSSYPIWDFLENDFIFNGNEDAVNVSMQVGLAAMSDSWRTGPGLFGINTTPFSIKSNSDDYSWEQFYVPFWSLWNDKQIPSINGFRNNIFNQMYDDVKKAPCAGPYRFGSYGDSDFDFTFEYGGNFRYFRDFAETHQGSGAIILGFFNGLDYMIIHNLMYLTAPTQLPVFEDLIDRQIDYQIQNGHVGVGSYGNNTNTEININAFHSITANELVNVNSNIQQVNFRAGYNQHFLSGFHVTAGTNFHAWLEPFECINDEYRIENDSTTVDDHAAKAYGFNEVFRFKKHSIINYDEDEITEEIEKIDPPMSETELLLVYPNPNNGVFNFTLTGIEKEKTRTVEIFNIMGELVYNKSINENYPVEMENVSSGIYIVKVTCGKEVYSAKILIE